MLESPSVSLRGNKCYVSNIFQHRHVIWSRKKPHPGPHWLLLKTAWGPAGYSEFSVGDLHPGSELRGIPAYTSLGDSVFFFLNDTTHDEFRIPDETSMMKCDKNGFFSWVFSDFVSILARFLWKHCFEIFTWWNDKKVHQGGDVGQPKWHSNPPGLVSRYAFWQPSLGLYEVGICKPCQ